jgi:site-specific recombinase XerD
MLSNMNVPYISIQERVGHSKRSITDIYSHVYESSSKEVAEMLNKIMKEMADVSEESGQQTTVA